MKTINKHGDAATPEALAKLALIAEHQTVSPVTDARYYQDINWEPKSYTDLPDRPQKVSLQTYMAKLTSFVSKGLQEIPEDEEDDYMAFVSDIAIYAANHLCDCTLAEISSVFGKTKAQGNAVRQRMTRAITAEPMLIQYLNLFRLELCS